MRGATSSCIGLSIVLATVASPTRALAESGHHALEHGAYIYAGTCGSIEGRVLFDIGDLEVERRPRRGAASELPGTGPVYEEDEDITATLAELSGTPHVVVVRERDDESSRVISCGAIQGEIKDGRLLVDLQPVDGSGVGGTALFGPNRDRDDDEPTDVVVRVRHGVAGRSGTGSRGV